MKRLLSLLLAIALLVGILPIQTSAASKPSITTQPKSVTAYVNTTAKFTVKATDADSYQWQYRTSATGTWKNTTATGAKTATLSVPASTSRSGYQYRCKVTNETGTVNSSAATLTVKETPVITTQPKGVTASVGTTAKFTVKAAGAKSYQWQYRTSSSASWKATTATGAKTATLSVPVTAAKNGYQYRCRVTNAVGTTNSNAATLTVKITTPEITEHPIDAITELGNTAKFTVKAAGAVTYQWLYCTTGTWKNATATGNKTATLSVSITESRNGYQYRCKMINAADEAFYSNAVTLTAHSTLPLTVVTQPENVIGATNDRVSFHVEVDGGKAPYTYRWQYHANYTSDDRFYNIYDNTFYSGTDTDTLTLTVVYSDYNNPSFYRCVITDADGNTVYSNQARVTNPLRVRTQPTDAIALVGEDAIFTVEPVGGSTPYNYQWQYGTADSDGNIVYTDIPTGAWAYGTLTNRLYFTVSEDKFDAEYRCVITDKNGDTAISDSAKIIRNPLSISTQPTDAVGKAPGSTATFSVVPEGGTAPYTYNWMYICDGMSGYDDVGSWASVSDNTLSLTVQDAYISAHYRFCCVITDANGYQITSESVRIVPPLKITTHPQGRITVANDFTVFQVGVTGDLDTCKYQWQYKTSEMTDFVNMSRFYWAADCTSDTLSVFVTQIHYMGDYQFRCVITDAAGQSVTTRAASLLVHDYQTTGSNTLMNDILYQPVSASGQIGDYLTFELEMDGRGGYAPYSFSWQVYNDNVWMEISHTEFDVYSQGHATYGIAELNYCVNTNDGLLDKPLRCVITDSTGAVDVTDIFYATLA